jgi:prephenate dehydrogenase
MKYNRIAIVGVGLIGGSFALSARRAHLANRITGWDREDVLAKGVSSGILDGVEDSFSSGRVSEADLVYLAAPVGQIISFLRDHSSQLKPGSIVTDAGSTKREICRAALDHIPRDVHFVGGHPMAGSHNSGIEFATEDLFDDAAYAIVPIDGGDSAAPASSGSDAAEQVARIVRALGSRPVFLTADEHDAAVAVLSHTPQLLATALAAAASQGRTSAIELAGPGFYETIRLAASRWRVWEDICRTNRDEIASALGLLERVIDEMRHELINGDLASLGRKFDEANEFTERLQTRKESVKG